MESSPAPPLRLFYKRDSSIGLQRTSLIAFVILALLECVPLWAFQNFPSQDGPEHLYNATVLATYQQVPAYRSAFNLNFDISTGNLTSHLILAGLIRWMSPLLAQKLLLTSLILGFFGAFYFVLVGISSESVYLAPLAGIFGPNLFLHLGFWNFYLSCILFLFTLGLFLQWRHEMTVIRSVLFGLLTLATYLTHLFGWIALYAAILPLCLMEIVADRRRQRSFSADLSFRRLLPLAIPFFLTLVLFVSFLLRGQDNHIGTISPNVANKLVQCVVPPFVQSLFPSESVYALCVGALLVGSLLIASSLRPLGAEKFDYLLGLFGIFLLLTLVTPDRFGEGSLIHIRFHFFGYIFLALWLSKQSWSNQFRSVQIGALVLLSMWSLIARWREYRSWDEILTSLQAMQSDIRPGSTVAYKCLGCEPTNVEPLLHADGLLAPLPFVNLSDYEAYTDHFPVRFKQRPVPSGSPLKSNTPNWYKPDPDLESSASYLIISSRRMPPTNVSPANRQVRSFKKVRCFAGTWSVCLYRRESEI